MSRALESIARFALLAVVMLRPLVAESYDSAAGPLQAALGDVGDATPLRTLGFDVLILTAALLWLVALALESKRKAYRRTGLEWGGVIIAIAAIVSCLFAGNQRLAINATIDWLCLPLLAISLAQLLRRAGHRNILLAGILATGCVEAFLCAEQSVAGFDETWAHYQETKESFWAKQGVPLDSGRVASFEQRILAREATGTLPHSNVTGSYLVLCVLVALGVTLMWRRRWREVRRTKDGERHGGAGPRAPPDAVAVAATLGAALVTLVLVGAALLTKSTGAIVSAEVAAAMWLVLWGFAPWLRRYRRRAFVVGWIGVGVAIGAVVGHGLRHDSLPGVSLTFRWHYWKTSASMIADHPLTGVGRENFGRHYLRYKPIESPEEVSNPHNLFVQAATDWGAGGLIGMIVMLVGASWVITKEPVRDARGSKEGAPRSPPSTLAWGAGLLLIVTIGRIALLGTDDPNYLYYIGMTTGLVWLAGFVLAGGWFRSAEDETTAEMVSVRRGVVFGAAAFVLHDLINFAIFVPGSATTLFALLGYLASFPSQGERKTQHDSPRSRWIPAGLAAIALGVALAVGLVPVGRSTRLLDAARAAPPPATRVPIEQTDAYVRFERAMAADPFDPTPCVRQAEWLMAVAAQPAQRSDALTLALRFLDRAIDRDPYSLTLRRMRIRVLRRRAEALGQSGDAVAAVEAARDALALYPEDPKGYILLGDCMFDAGQALGSAKWLDEAEAAYRDALSLDARRLPWERLRRFSKPQRAAITTKIKRIRSLRREERR